MNSSPDDFQNKLNEIGKYYEDGKDAIRDMTYIGRCGPYQHAIPFAAADKALECLRNLRDIAAMAVKAALKPNPKELFKKK